MTTADAAAFHRERMERAPDEFGADVLTRLRRGAAFGAADYADARRRQTLLRRTFESWFVEHGGELDVVVLPTTPCVAPRIAGLDAVTTAPVLTRLTAPFNFTGLPALSVPCGVTSEGLPVGLQIVGAPWAERVCSALVGRTSRRHRAAPRIGRAHTRRRLTRAALSAASAMVVDRRGLSWRAGRRGGCFLRGRAAGDVARSGGQFLESAGAAAVQRGGRDDEGDVRARDRARTGAARRRSIPRAGAGWLLRRLAVLSRGSRIHRAVRHRRRSGGRAGVEGPGVPDDSVERATFAARSRSR